MKAMKIGILMAVMLVLVGSASALKLYASDVGGTEKDTFVASETVYAYGTGLANNTNYCLYVIVNTNSYTTGMTLTDASGGRESVTTDNNGNLPTNPTIVWAPNLVYGDYDLVANYGCTGTYDGNLDEVDQKVGVGFNVVPESAIAVALIALLVPGMIYVVRKRK